MTKGGKRSNSGRKRKPVAKHALDGTVPDYKPNGLSGDGVPVKPRGLRGLAGQLWDEIEGQLVQWGACEADSIYIADMCRWWASYRQQHSKGKFAAAKKCWDAFNSIASRYGLTLSDRAKLEIKSASDDDAREGKFYGVVG